MEEDEPLYDFTLIRGNTFPISVTWTDEAGDAIDITGFSATFVTTPPEGGTALSLTSAGGRITLGGVAGTIVLELTAAETEAFVVDGALGQRTVRCPYELRLTDGSGRKETVLKGKLLVSFSPIEG